MGGRGGGRPRRWRGSGTASSACSSVLDSTADSRRAGIWAVVAARRSADGEDEVAGTGLLAGDRQIRHLKTTTRPVPALIGPGQRATARLCLSLGVRPWSLTAVCTWTDGPGPDSRR